MHVNAIRAADWEVLDTLQEQNECADFHYNEYQSWSLLELKKNTTHFGIITTYMSEIVFV